MDKVVFITYSELSPFKFYAQSLLARSLRRISSDSFNLIHYHRDKTSRAQAFNDAIDSYDDCTILVFVDDDVWIDDWLIYKRLFTGLDRYDVLSLSGLIISNKLCLGVILDDFVSATYNSSKRLESPHSLQVGRSLFSDSPGFGVSVEHLSESKFVDLITGRIVASRAGTLKKNKIYFDPAFDEYLHTADFSIAIKNIGLSIGILDAAITQKNYPRIIKSFVLEAELFSFKEKRLGFSLI